MSGIRGKDTKPELIVRKFLHSMGYRYRLHRRDLPGKPDIVLPKYRIAIFVNGCYWHRHKDCKLAYNPKSNTEFWQTKFRQNVLRDTENHETLTRAGWKVIVVWECEVRDGSFSQLLLEQLKN